MKSKTPAQLRKILVKLLIRAQTLGYRVTVDLTEPHAIKPYGRVCLQGAIHVALQKKILPAAKAWPKDMKTLNTLRRENARKLGVTNDQLRIVEMVFGDDLDLEGVTGFDLMAYAAVGEQLRRAFA